MDCLFRVKTITLETANVTNCHVIATDILFLSSNHRSVQFLYLAASLAFSAAILKFRASTQTIPEDLTSQVRAQIPHSFWSGELLSEEISGVC